MNSMRNNHFIPFFVKWKIHNSKEKALKIALPISSYQGFYPTGNPYFVNQSQVCNKLLSKMETTHSIYFLINELNINWNLH